MKEENWKKGEKKEMKWDNIREGQAGGARESRSQGIKVIFKGETIISLGGVGSWANLTL